MSFLTDEEIDRRIAMKSNRSDGLANVNQQQSTRPSWMPPIEQKDIGSYERTFGGTLKDVGVSIGKGLVGTGQAAIGLADIVTPGQLGKGLESAGVDLGAAQEYLSEQYTPAQKAAFERVEKAKGFLPTLGTMVQNPSTIVHSVVESLPAVAGGGLVGRGALALAPRIGGLAAGAIGEGAVTTGQTAEGIREQADTGEISGKQSLLALGAGVGTGALGLVGGTIARKFGVGDIDTMLASKQFAEKSNKGVVRRIIEGGISEGAFEELPQSIQEQVWMNAATGKDLTEGIGEAGAAGLLAGTAMGGGVNVFQSTAREHFNQDELEQLNQEQQDIQRAESEAVTPEEQKEVQTRKENFTNTLSERKEAIELQQGIAKSPEEIRSDRQALYDQWWALPTEKSAQESAETILAQKPLSDIEQAQRDRQRQIAETYLPAEIEADRINQYRLAEAEQAGEPEPVPLRPTDLITRKGQPYQRREYLEGYLEALPNGNDYKIINVPNGFVARLTDEALDPRRDQVVWEDETGRYPSERAYWNAQREAIRRQQETPLQTATERRVPFEEILPRANQAAIEAIEYDVESTVPIGEGVTQSEVTPATTEVEQPVESVVTREEVGPVEEPEIKIQYSPADKHRRFRALNEMLRTDVNAGETWQMIEANKDQFTPEEVQRLRNYFNQNPVEITRATINDVAREAQIPGLMNYDKQDIGFEQIIKESITDQEIIREDFQAREDLISDMESELEANQIEQDRLDVADPMRGELELNAEEIRTQIQDAKRELLIDRLTNRGQFEVRSEQEPGQGITLPEIQKMYKDQEVFQGDDGAISIRLKNGKGITFQNIQDVGNGFIEYAIQTGQMSKDGKILGVTQGSNVLLDKDFADKKTAWHESGHVWENLGMIRDADISALNKEFNKLRKKDQLEFDISTHEDAKQAMVENRWNTFAQVMVNREQYQGTTLGKMIQRIMDFVDKMFSFGQQTIRGLAREVESGRFFEREATEQDQIAPQFQVADLTKPEQKISDDVYRDIYEQQSNLVEKLNQNIKKTGRDINRGMNKYLGMISTNLKKINPMLEAKVRKLGFDTTMRIKDDLTVAKPLLDKLKDMSSQDKSDWHWARVNGDSGRIRQITDKYGMTDDYNNVRESLNRIRRDGEAVGYNIGFIDEYWPRILKDRTGFLQATRELSNEPVFSRALKAQADKQGITVDALDDGLKADIISNIILGRPSGLGGPVNIRQRYFAEVPPEFAKFYMDSDAALMSYIYAMNKKIEARKFFGKVPERIARIKKDKRTKETRLANLTRLESDLVADGQDTTTVKEQINDLVGDIQIAQNELDKYGRQDDFKENIGSYVMDLMVQEKIKPGTGVKENDEQALKDILTARFNEKGTTGLANVYKNLSYIDTMGNPVSAITQLGDLAWAVYVGGLTQKGIANSVKNIGKAIIGKSDITREDIGITRIAQEFADGDTLSNAVSKIFKLVGIEKLDRIGKEALINNSFDNYRTKAERAAKDPKEMDRFKAELKPIFGAESEKVINDLLDQNIAKQSEDVRLLVYSRLLDFQPADLSETPEAYLNAGNGRLFYMLKMFTLKQFDVFRREVWHNIKTGERDKVLAGLGNMTRLMAVLSLANAGADELKDWVLGKDTKFEDHVIENLLSLGGASRYLRMQTTREGIGSGLAGQILPPFKFIDAISKDVMTDTRDGLRSVDSIPVGGKLYYWHFGRGKDARESVEEKDFAKEVKKIRKFKKDFDAAEDKRLFLRSNLDQFKQMKFYDNMTKALRGNKATINKLKDIEQTPNVRKRLSQLEQQRKDLINRYFEMKKQYLKNLKGWNYYDNS